MNIIEIYKDYLVNYQNNIKFFNRKYLYKYQYNKLKILEFGLFDNVIIYL